MKVSIDEIVSEPATTASQNPVMPRCQDVASNSNGWGKGTSIVGKSVVCTAATVLFFSVLAYFSSSVGVVIVGECQINQNFRFFFCRRRRGGSGSSHWTGSCVKGYGWPSTQDLDRYWSSRASDQSHSKRLQIY